MANWGFGGSSGGWGNPMGGGMRGFGRSGGARGFNSAPTELGPFGRTMPGGGSAYGNLAPGTTPVRPTSNPYAPQPGNTMVTPTTNPFASSAAGPSMPTRTPAMNQPPAPTLPPGTFIEPDLLASRGVFDPSTLYAGSRIPAQNQPVTQTGPITNGDWMFNQGSPGLPIPQVTRDVSGPKAQLAYNNIVNRVNPTVPMPRSPDMMEQQIEQLMLRNRLNPLR